MSSNEELKAISDLFDKVGDRCSTGESLIFAALLMIAETLSVMLDQQQANAKLSAKLAEQFDKVSTGGNALITEAAQ